MSGGRVRGGGEMERIMRANTHMHTHTDGKDKYQNVVST